MIEKHKLLVVDDDDAVIDYLHSKLGDRYDIVSTNAPENVLALVRKELPSLILCDIDMPEMDGGDISKALFADAELREIPLLFVTALMTPGDLKAKGNQIGGRPAISKSSPHAELIKKIETLTR